MTRGNDVGPWVGNEPGKTGAGVGQSKICGLSTAAFFLRKSGLLFLVCILEGPPHFIQTEGSFGHFG